MASKHKGQFKIVTRSGKTVSYACSKEEAEYIISGGRNRRALAWDNKTSSYKN